MHHASRVNTPMPDTAQDWIDHLHLEHHPEGGYYRETYRTDESLPESALPERFDGPRDVAAFIYFLLPADSFSALHRIQQDEVWHFYAGAPITLHQIGPDEDYRTETLGRTVTDGQKLHIVVPAGTWFGATVDADDGYGLAGCTTAPAFEFSDFELADCALLAQAHPQYEKTIERLTR